MPQLYQRLEVAWAVKTFWNWYFILVIVLFYINLNCINTLSSLIVLSDKTGNCNKNDLNITYVLLNTVYTCLNTRNVPYWNVETVYLWYRKCSDDEIGKWLVRMEGHFNATICKRTLVWPVLGTLFLYHVTQCSKWIQKKQQVLHTDSTHVFLLIKYFLHIFPCWKARIQENIIYEFNIYR